ncbi:hypothetical protein CVT26_015050 [Gymnopilus dilepis]|uniref:Uncharacterized protein n=1 Tax=Gymnopilus dilepis TaxID=231916 RepID=A0A409W423_9AGAR|nr:hypothetical protein CVT26_015050 [Gymnopilus dilepis]
MKKALKNMQDAGEHDDPELMEEYITCRARGIDMADQDAEYFRKTFLTLRVREIARVVGGMNTCQRKYGKEHAIGEGFQCKRSDNEP